MPEKKKEQVLSVRDLDITFKTTAGPVHAIRGVNIDLYKGETVALVGESGSGKSVTMKAAMGILAQNAIVNSGSIQFSYHHADGSPETVDLLQKDKKWIRRHINGKRIAMVFQDPMTGTAADMQIAENLAIAARRGKGRTLRSGVSKKEKVQYAEMLKELDLGLDTRLTSKVGLLSGGQRQKHIPLNAEHRIKRRKALYGAVIAAELPKRVNYNDHQHECGGDFIDNGLILRLFCSSFVLCHHSVLSFDSKFLYTV